MPKWGHTQRFARIGADLGGTAVLTRPRTPEEKSAVAQAALRRARDGRSKANELAVIAAFAERGLEAIPRENVLTYHAWRALDRQVRKGEHGVSIRTWFPVKQKDGRPDKLIPKRTTVFHVSQTDAQPA